MASRVEYIENHFPKLLKWAERRAWHRVLLLVAIGLLIANVWDIENHLSPEPAPLVVTIPAPAAPAISEMSQQIAELQRQLREKPKAITQAGTSDAVRIYPISHDQRSSAPKIEYVMTTEKIRTPAEIIANCDFPISTGSARFLTLSGGSSETTDDRRMSATQYRFIILSPPWSPTNPLWITIFFEGVVDRMPSCALSVQ